MKSVSGKSGAAKNKFELKGAFALALTIALAFFAVGCRQLNGATQSNSAQSSSSQNNQRADASQPTRETPTAPISSAVVSYSPVVSRAAPAVVTVQSGRRARSPQQFPFSDDPRFREFFGDEYGGRSPQQQQRQAPPAIERGIGSGVIVSPDGFILTNHHVIDGAEEIRVALTDRRTFDARVVGSDPPSDLALLKVEANNLPILNLGDSNRVEVGDVVLALGNPLGLQQTVTAGIISAKNRSTGLSDGSFEDFLQTDAPINQGNSGGALINTTGELIGINSQILSPTGGNIGIGFAIPSNMARGVMEQLRTTGTVRRGQLGVVVQAVTSELAQRLNLPGARGVLVAAVQPESPAARAGVQQNDVITAFNNAPVNESNELRNLVANTAPGTEVTLTVVRNGGEQQLRAALGELQSSTARSGVRE